MYKTESGNFNIKGSHYLPESRWHNIIKMHLNAACASAVPNCEIYWRDNEHWDLVRDVESIAPLSQFDKYGPKLKETE